MKRDRVAAYTDDLARELRARGAYTRNFLDEVRDHLVDSVEAGKRRGLSSDAAEDEALTNIGAPGIVAQYAAANVPRFRRALLLTLCLCTIAAVGYLSLSLMVLRPPRASQAWPAEAVFVLVVSVLTFAWTKSGGLHPWIRPLLVAGALALGAFGGLSIHAAVAGDFEGYSVVLGTLFITQALLTLAQLQSHSRGFLRRL
jgi:hypothetical protein